MTDTDNKQMLRVRRRILSQLENRDHLRAIIRRKVNTPMRQLACAVQRALFSPRLILGVASVILPIGLLFGAELNLVEMQPVDGQDPPLNGVPIARERITAVRLIEVAPGILEVRYVADRLFSDGFDR